MHRAVYLSLFILLLAAPRTATELRAQELRLGDGVRLTLFNVDDEISGDYFVMTDWTMQLPYIGQVGVQSREFPAVRDEISDRYNSIYRNPELSIQPLFRVSVLGEVQSPGIYFVTGFERLTDLMAMAGGETLDANLDKVYLQREGEKIDINAREILKRGDTLSDFGLISGDQLYVSRVGLVSYRNASLLISGAGVLATLAAIFLVRR
ncbi:MAG: SLBB domain-containing protein [Rhodothermales bacterium]|nr:SLBB domain-containing protein [Rhodothermales bacterium]